MTHRSLSILTTLRKHARLGFVLAYAHALGSCASDEQASLDELELGEAQASLVTGTALFVASSTSLSSADTAIRNRLQTLGLTVVVKSASSTTSADATGKVLIVISSTVTPAYVGTKFRSVAVPVLTWESQLYDEFGMTPTSFGSAGTQSLQRNLAIAAPTHPVAGGLSGTVAVTSSSSTFNYGKPNANAVRIATLTGDASRVAVFAYDAGVSMPGLVAPARRIGLFLGDSTASVLTTNGWRIFERAVEWAAAPRSTPGDSDNDRLPDTAETNTGAYVSTSNTGTSPNNPDTDGDGLADGDEVLGTTAGLNLPGLGVSPLRKDLLVEHDWFRDALECAAHTHRPTGPSMQRITTAFANGPVSNPDGSRGIRVIHDYGQGGLFTGGNEIVDVDSMSDGVVGTEFQAQKSSNFAPNRMGYFHYVLHAHGFLDNPSFSGNGETLGDDSMIALRCNNTEEYVAFAVMHELGHNLGLQHGGDTLYPYKPNYNSIMNYTFNYVGIDTNCDPIGDGVLDFSRNQRIALDERALRESAGTCGTVPWDWNGNGAIDTQSIQADLDNDQAYNVLRDYDDWGHLVLSWQTVSRAARFDAQVSCEGPRPSR